jgi:hypothetical protein
MPQGGWSGATKWPSWAGLKSRRRQAAARTAWRRPETEARGRRSVGLGWAGSAVAAPRARLQAASKGRGDARGGRAGASARAHAAGERADCSRDRSEEDTGRRRASRAPGDRAIPESCQGPGTTINRLAVLIHSVKMRSEIGPRLPFARARRSAKPIPQFASQAVPVNTLISGRNSRNLMLTCLTRTAEWLGCTPCGGRKWRHSDNQAVHAVRGGPPGDPEHHARVLPRALAEPPGRCPRWRAAAVLLPGLVSVLAGGAAGTSRRSRRGGCRGWR